MADPYIVVLDVTADAIRALLFDSEARRVEGYSAQLPKRADAGADCLDEMHRLVDVAGFRIAAVVGHADRLSWPAFEGTSWFPALPEGAGVILGCGCVDRERFGLVIAGEKSMLLRVTQASDQGQRGRISRDCGWGRSASCGVRLGRATFSGGL
jgi:hypothetical protein